MRTFFLFYLFSYLLRNPLLALIIVGAIIYFSEARYSGRYFNPASYYTLELLPLFYERFHEWHVRMGMERSPLEGFRCC